MACSNSVSAATNESRVAMRRFNCPRENASHAGSEVVSLWPLGGPLLLMATFKPSFIAATTRSCSANRSSILPSILTVRTSEAARTSTSSAVMRISAPRRW